jgi:hypothetical protein
MEEKKIMRQLTLETEIWDVDLPQKINMALSTEPVVTDPQHYYAFDVVFDSSVYNMQEFYAFKLDKPVMESHYSKTQNAAQEHLKEILYAVLNQQLSKVSSVVSDTGIDICNSAIIGDMISNAHTVEFFLYEDKEKEYDKKGKLKRNIRVSSVLPDRPQLRERAAKFMAEMFLKKYKENLITEMEVAAHTVNIVRANEVFREVASACLLDIRMSKEKRANTTFQLSDTLREHALVKSTWPLEIEGQINGKPLPEPLAPDYGIDCPEYLLYHEHRNGTWTLKKIDGLSVAQYIITKEGYNQKTTVHVAVLHNLKPVRFSLYAETDSGLVPVKKTDASNYKKLNLCWKDQ